MITVLLYRVSSPCPLCDSVFCNGWSKTSCFLIDLSTRGLYNYIVIRVLTVNDKSIEDNLLVSRCVWFERYIDCNRCMSTFGCKIPEIPRPRLKSMVERVNKCVCVCACVCVCVCVCVYMCTHTNRWHRHDTHHLSGDIRQPRTSSVLKTADLGY